MRSRAVPHRRMINISIAQETVEDPTCTMCVKTVSPVWRLARRMPSQQLSQPASYLCKLAAPDHPSELSQLLSALIQPRRTRMRSTVASSHGLLRQRDVDMRMRVFKEVELSGRLVERQQIGPCSLQLESLVVAWSEERKTGKPCRAMIASSAGSFMLRPVPLPDHTQRVSSRHTMRREVRGTSLLTHPQARRLAFGTCPFHMTHHDQRRVAVARFATARACSMLRCDVWA
mmetsp:Transcript_13144/g.29921  ORF Transcript_13144/g.29921 Transcript_13144/m.29921 type:complete len:231 (-) Transcript_13144:94-786(-)